MVIIRCHGEEHCLSNRIMVLLIYLSFSAINGEQKKKEANSDRSAMWIKVKVQEKNKTKSIAIYLSPSFLVSDKNISPSGYSVHCFQRAKVTLLILGGILDCDLANLQWLRSWCFLDIIANSHLFLFCLHFGPFSTPFPQLLNRRREAKEYNPSSE